MSVSDAQAQGAIAALAQFEKNIHNDRLIVVLALSRDISDAIDDVSTGACAGWPE